MSATRSLASVPGSYLASRGLSVNPMPRWSGATTSKSRARVGISMRQAYQVWGQPWTSSSGGPSPPMTACRRSWPVSTYRLVKVSVNPAGSCGAPQTEPGPSGVGAELMRSSFRKDLPQCPEGGPEFLGEELGLFPGGEVAASVELVVVERLSG